MSTQKHPQQIPFGPADDAQFLAPQIVQTAIEIEFLVARRLNAALLCDALSERAWHQVQGVKADYVVRFSRALDAALAGLSDEVATLVRDIAGGWGYRSESLPTAPDIELG